jgi:hypothetical protein
VLGAPATSTPSLSPALVNLPLGAGLLLSWPVLRGGRALRERVSVRRHG